jgi:hypothetical protein
MTAIGVLVAASLIAGCGGSTSTVPTTRPSLTPAQQQAATSSGNGVEYSAAVSAALSTLASPQVNGTGSASGGGPAITVIRTSSGFTATADYGAGIPGAGHATTSGSVAISVDTSAHAGTVTFNDFTVDGRTIGGTMTLSGLSYNTSGVSGTVAVNLAVGGIGTVVGDLALSYAAVSQTMAITHGNLTYTDTTGNVYTLTLTDIAFSYAATGNLIPYAGTMAIGYTPAGSSTPVTLRITFNPATPVTHSVSVSVNGGSVFIAELSGLET